MCTSCIKFRPNISGEEYVQRVAVKSAVDLGSGLRWAEPTVPCLFSLTGKFQLKIRLAEVQSCLHLVTSWSYFHAVFYEVSAVHKFDFRLVTNYQKTTSYSDRESCF